MNEPTPSPALKLLKILSADYDYPWPDEDSDMREHRERRLSQINELLTIAASGTPAPSLGEEVSDEANAASEAIHSQYQAAIKTMFGVEPFNDGSNTKRLIAEEIQHALSTARAQDKAALAEKDETIARLRRNFQDAEAAVSNVLRLLPNRETDSWEDAVNGWLKETAAFRAENERLNTEIEQWRHENDGLRTRGNELISEVARLKAEVEETKIYATRLKASINGSGPRDVDYMTALEREKERLDGEMEAIVRYIRESKTDGIEDCAPAESIAVIISQRDNAYNEARDLRTRLAQAEKERDECVKMWQLAYDLLTERFGLQCLSIQAPGFAASKYDDAIAARDLAEQRVRELEARCMDRASQMDDIALAAGRPPGVTLLAWVAALAEDKRRIDWLESFAYVGASIQPVKDWHWHAWKEVSLRSAIDASNPKTE